MRSGVSQATAARRGAAGPATLAALALVLGGVLVAWPAASRLPRAVPAAATPATVPASPLCTVPAPPGGEVRNDLYCMELYPSPDLDGASGVAELGWAATPFGVAVNADGEHQYAFSAFIEGLPDPATLGPYTTYVAWVTTPILRPMVKLGEVRNGWTRLSRGGFNKFLVLVTAEASNDVDERQGRIVMRGMSPSMRMEPHDLPFVLAAAAGLDGHDAHAQHAGHGAHEQGATHGQRPQDGPDAGRAPVAAWAPPPMHPRITMPPGLMHLRPEATPFLPGATGARPAGAGHGVHGAGGDGATSHGAIPIAVPRRPIRLSDGDTLKLVAGPVRRTIHGRTFVMYGFNGQYPGPLLVVDEGVTVVVEFENRTDLPSAVHWHGVRLENRFDGVPHVTQEPVLPGGEFRYEVHFKDAGIYWYHPHHREDIAQDLGLYGNMLVRSPDPEYYGPANREEVLMLDDLLIGDQGLVPYGWDTPIFALMGRFGNVLLVNGEPEYALEVDRGEVVRFHLTNVANTRTFNVSFGGARMKVVASDVGRFEREEWVESVVLAPAERYVVDVRFDSAGVAAFTNRIQSIDHVFGAYFPEVDTLGLVRVRPEPASPDHGEPFARLRAHVDVTEEIAPYRPYFDQPAELELELTLELAPDEDTGDEARPVDVARRTDAPLAHEAAGADAALPDRLPFPLGPLIRMDSLYFNPVEWSGTMPDMNWLMTGRNTRWVLREPSTGRENMDIAWRFRQGDVVRIRLQNDRHAAHAMQHPIHIHGQRFLILSQNGVPNGNLVWKDTMLLPVGVSAEILLELSNPGRWLLHCHVAEHMEVGMMMVFEVEADG